MAAMRNVLAWLGAATLLLVCSIAGADSGTALKPYVTLILDTSGSMSGATGSGPPTCGYHCSTHTNTLCATSANCPGSETCVAPPDQKFTHAKCALNNIANSYGDIVFALARYRATLGGTVSGEFPNGCTAPDLYCSGTGTPGTDAQFQLLSGLVDGGNAAAAKWVNFTGNSCDGSGTDPEIWNIPSNTPLGGVLLGSQRYYSGLQATDTTTIWPSTSAGFDPILNDPTNSVFLGPTNCDPSAACTTNCCTSQCRPYITILLTDGAETCGGNAPNAATAMLQWSHVHSIQISNIVRSGGTVTVTTATAHPFAVGNSIVINGVTNTAYNGTFTIATVANNTHFTYAQAGTLAASSGGYAAQNDPVAISAITRASNVVTVTTATTHKLQVGQSVVIAGVTASAFNGTFTVTGAADTTHFTYAQTAANASSSGGTASHAAMLYNYTVQTKVIGFGVTPGTATIEDIAHAGGAPDVPLVNEGYYASDEAGLELAISDIIAKSVRSETCNNLDDDCDTRIDEDFPTKGAACSNGEKGVCLVNGLNACRADGTGVQCDAGTAACAGLPDNTACSVTNSGGTAIAGKCSGGICNPFLVQGTNTEICQQPRRRLRRQDRRRAHRLHVLAAGRALQRRRREL